VFCGVSQYDIDALNYCDSLCNYKEILRVSLNVIALSVIYYMSYRTRTRSSCGLVSFLDFLVDSKRYGLGE